MIRDLLIAGVGGAIRSMLRTGISFLFRNNSFPYATLLINVAGSFVIGLIMALTLKNAIHSERALFLATGICGGFTTFSAFSYENVKMLQEGRYGIALLYIMLTIIAGLGATWIGFKLVS